MAATVAELQGAIDAAVARLGISRGDRTAYVPDHVSRDAGYPFFWVDGPTLHYGAHERGQLLGERTTTDPDELVGWVVADVTRDLAGEWERRHRRPGEDFRRQYFARWVELTTRVDPRYGERVRAYVDEVLEVAPFRDRPPSGSAR